MSLNRVYPATGHDVIDQWPWFDGSIGMRSRHPFTPFEETRTSRMMPPRMDLHENPEKNLVTATFELPGLSKDNVNIDVQDGNLAVSGEASQTSSQQEQGYTIKERKFGRFTRSIKLPEGTNPKDVKASMENGILTVTYPKSSPGQEPQRIAIK